MALTVSTLITAAKKRAFGAKGRQKLSNPMLVEELSYQDTQVMQMLSQIAPDILTTISGSITFTDSGNLNGYTLQDGMHYRDFSHIDPNIETYRTINIVQRQHRNRPLGAPSAMVRLSGAAGVFHPIDPLRKRWADAGGRNWFEPAQSHTMSYSYVPIPAALTSLSDTLASPDMAREVFLTALEVRILLSNPQATPEWELRVQSAVRSLQTSQESLRWMATKFVNPQGQPGRRGAPQSDSVWVSDQVNR